MSRGRTLAWLLALLGAYAVSLGQVPWSRGAAGFSPFAPRPHAVEQLIVARQFDRALPLAAALQKNYPKEPLPAMWLARASEGTGRWREAATAWEAYVGTSPSPVDACPSLPRAYERADDEAHALPAYERCARFDPEAPGPIEDLAAAYARRGQSAEALAAYRRAQKLAPDDPELRQEIASVIHP